MSTNVSPSVDFQSTDDRLLDDLNRALSVSGYAILTGLDQWQEATLEMMDTCEGFFRQRLPKKLLWRRREGDWRGYFPADDSAERHGEFVERLEYGRDDIDLCEREPLCLNRTPTIPPKLAPIWVSYYRVMEAINIRLLTATADYLDLSKLDIACWTSLHTSELCANYFHDTAVPLSNVVGLKPHTDFGGFTILAIRGESPVLKITSPGGGQHQVTPLEGQYVVQVGDLLSMASGGRWPACPHEVAREDRPESVCVTGQRLSLAYFHLPNPSMKVKGWTERPGNSVADYLKYRVDTY